MENIVKYPIGDQDFRSVRHGGFLYIDKTRYIESIVEGGKYIFLARPRRFGKSLFLSTLQYFFEGDRELFKGLYADSMDWDWQPYPVFRLDLYRNEFAEQDKLNAVLDRLFREWEAKYGIEAKDSDPAARFGYIISETHRKTGRQVVILVDEYDKPLVGNLNKNENFEHYRTQLASLYTNFKNSAEHIRLVFITGVSRFSKLSVFSALNNINDISFDDKYADICGITEKELHSRFKEGIMRLADNEHLGYEETLQALKHNYDGYRFAIKGSDIYNPWSVLNCMEKGWIGNYWNETGIPTIVAEALKRSGADLEEVFNSTCSPDDLKGMDILEPQPLPLLYQTGYLTIKEYNVRRRKFRLGIPNNEVRKGLMKVLLPYYVKTKAKSAKDLADDIVDSLETGEPDRLMKLLQTFFSSIPYEMQMDNENNIHNALFVLLYLIGTEVRTEYHTSDGRIDLLIETDDYIYIIELKFDKTAADAMNQIEEKQYARPFGLDSRRIFRIGINYSSKTRTIEDWVIS